MNIAACPRQCSGRGTCAYGDGSEYVGQWRSGQRHGHGTLTDKRTGESYDGQWSNGQRHGTGVLSDGRGDRAASRGWRMRQRAMAAACRTRWHTPPGTMCAIAATRACR